MTNISKNVQQKRNCGLELLRLVLMLMVCMLHVLKTSGVLGIANNIAYKTYWFLEIACYCAVDGFVLLSGYTAKNKPNNYSKLVQFWLQVFFYSFILTIILSLFGVGKLTLKTLVLSFFPIIFRRFWFATAYFVLFLAKPILNTFVFETSENSAKTSFIVIVVLFSFVSVFSNSFDLNGGFSAFWLIILYCIGALAKRIKLFEKRNNFILLLLWLVSLLLTWITRVLLGTSRLVSYTSPTILLSGLIMVILFSRFKFKSGFIYSLASLAFGVYLFHTNTVFYTNIIKPAFTFIVNKPLLAGIGYVFVCSFAVFAAGIVVEFIRTKLYNLFRLDKLCDRVVFVINKIIAKMFVFLN